MKETTQTQRLDMDETADDNFFIDEPQKLRHSFFNKDKPVQVSGMLLQKNRDVADNLNNDRPQTRYQTCRLTYLKKLQHIQPQRLSNSQTQATDESQNQSQQQLHIAPIAIPRSFVSRLKYLCQATCEFDDIALAQQAVETLTSASKTGCCFLERYIVVLLNYCLRKRLEDKESKKSNDDSTRTHKTKIDELMDKLLLINFDRQQLTDNLRRSELKLSSLEQLIQLIRRVRDLLDYREEIAVNWLFAILDAYTVQLATSDETMELMDQIATRIDNRCILLREIKSTNSILGAITEHLGSMVREKLPHYVEEFEF